MADNIEAAITGALASARENGTLEESTEEVEDTSSPDIINPDDDDTVVEEAVADDTTTTTTTTEKPVEKPTEKVEEAVDKLLEELKTTKSVGKDNKIPYSRVKEIVGNKEQKIVETVAKSFGLDAKTLKFEGLEAAITEKVGGYQALEERAKSFDFAENIIANDPDRYIRILATVEPEKYSKFLTVLGEKPKAAATTEETEEDLLKDMPEPDFDIDLGDGKTAKTYSTNGIKDLIKFAINVGKKQAEGVATKVTKPITDRETKAAQDAASKKKFDEDLAEAQTWPEFTENFSDILAALKADRENAERTRTRPKLRSLHDAYIKVVAPKLKEGKTVSEQAMRAKILKEMEKTTTSTGITPNIATKPKPKESDDPITDAIKSSIRKAGLK